MVTKPWQIPYLMENGKMVVSIQNHDKFIVLIWKTLDMRFGSKIRINLLHSVTNTIIYTMILCCPCYMPKYVPRLDGIMHDPKGSALCLLTLGHISAYNMDNTILLLLLLWMPLVILKNEICLKCIDIIKIGI